MNFSKEQQKMVELIRLETVLDRNTAEYLVKNGWTYEKQTLLPPKSCPSGTAVEVLLDQLKIVQGMHL